jgi:hypothetical protein
LINITFVIKLTCYLMIGLDFLINRLNDCIYSLTHYWMFLVSHNFIAHIDIIIYFILIEVTFTDIFN